MIKLNVKKDLNVLNVLDNFFGFDQQKSSVESFKEFITLKRNQSQNIREFIQEFDTLYNRNKKNGNILCDYLVADLLIEACNVSDLTKRIVNATNSNITYNNVKETLKKIFYNSDDSTQSILDKPVSTITKSKHKEVEDIYCRKSKSDRNSSPKVSYN